MKIKKGDTIKVLIGKDKGKSGKVDRIFPKKMRVLVDGINQYKKHFKARTQNPASQQGGQKSEILTITKPIPVANIAVVCPRCKKPTRIGFKLVEDSKVRICKKCNKEID